MGVVKKHGLPVYLITEGVLKTPRILHAFEKVDRRDFVPRELRRHAYDDTALPIGYGQTISQPYTVAFMLELLQPQKGQSILDVGSGSGWTTALLAHVVGKEGKVVGLELIPDLAESGRSNLRKYDTPQAEIRSTGHFTNAAAEYDRILVSAAADTVPEELMGMLKPGGILVMPIQGAIVRIHKRDDGALSVEKHEGFAFVPLHY